MKAQKLKQGKGYDNRVMYCFGCSMDIIVEEKQKNNNTLDSVILHYAVKDGDKAYFSKEIVCGELKAENKTLIMKNPQIVNGCQTCNSLYEVKRKGNDLSKAQIIVKVIESTKPEVT